LSIGASAPDFNLPGVDGKNYRLQDFSGSNLLVLVFTCNHCPTAQAYESRIQKLADDYRSRGVALVAISPNDPESVRLDELGYSDMSDTLEEMKVRARERKFTFPYLYDGETQSVSLAYGPVATPHVFILDRARKLRFAGRIDDSENPARITAHDTRNAIDALLAGKPVPIEKTRTFGCSTKWSDKRADAAKSLAKWDQEEVKLSAIDEAGLARLANNDTNKLLVVNIWATWCGPCVAELPEFVTMHRMYRKRNFELVTISMDEAEAKDAALKTLRENHASCTNYIASVKDKDLLAEALDKEWQGPLPYTLLIAPGGKIIYRHTGPIEPLELRRKIADTLGRTYANRAQ
jgi:peroxiredoxin